MTTHRHLHYQLLFLYVLTLLFIRVSTLYIAPVTGERPLALHFKLCERFAWIEADLFVVSYNTFRGRGPV